MDCLVEGGYSALGLREVLRRADVSRGAGHYHFNNKAELVSALVEHVHERRIEMFLNEYLCRIASEPNREALWDSAELYGSTLATREFIAFLELSVAARTDSELNEVFLPAVRKFDAIWMREMTGAFPQWGERIEQMKIAADFVQSAYLGLLMNSELYDADRRQKVRQVINDAVVMIYDRKG